MYREQIRNLYDRFSPGYRRIADFLLGRYQDAAFMTAAEIAREVQVDTALVVRFAQRLGYPGFPELITDVQTDVKRDLRAVYEPPEGDNSPSQVFKRNLLQDRNNLDYLMLHLDLETIEKIIGLLKGARRIFVAGEGNTAYLAEAFAVRLLVLGYNASLMPSELAGQAALGATIERNDVIIGIGTTAMTPGPSVIMKSARELGAHTVGIVASVTHPIASVAEHVVYAPVMTVGILPSWTAISAVLHALGQAVSLDGGDMTANWAARTDHFLRGYSETLERQLTGVRDTISQYLVSRPQEVR